MNEEALEYAYELFKKDGYSESLEDYKSLISENEEALSYTYDLFKKDGYTDSLDDLTNLLIPKQEADAKVDSGKEVADFTESPLTSAQKPSDSGLGSQETKEEVVVSEPDEGIVSLYDQYKQSGEISTREEESIKKVLEAQKKGDRSFWEKAEAYAQGFIRTGDFTPMYRWDSEESLREKKEEYKKKRFLESLPNDKREELHKYAVNRTRELGRSSVNILSENSMLEEKAKSLSKELQSMSNAAKALKDEGRPLPEVLIQDLQKKKSELDSLAFKYNENFDTIESNNEDIGSFFEELDLLKRNYTGLNHYRDLSRLTTADMIGGLMEFGVSTGEVIDETIGEAIGDEGLLEERRKEREETREFIKDYREESSKQRSVLRPTISVEEIEDSRTFGRWLAEQTAMQLPVMTTLAASGGTSAGLGLLSASSAGSKMGELRDERAETEAKIEEKREEIKRLEGETFVDPEVKETALRELKALEDKPVYGLAETYLAGVGYGMAEFLTEKVSLGILSKGKRAMQAAVKTDLKKGIKDYTVDFVKTSGASLSSAAKEGASETVNTWSQNLIDILYLGDEDKHVFEGTTDALSSGAAMGFGMRFAPTAIGMGAKAFTTKTNQDRISSNSREIESLLHELETGKETLSESTKNLMTKKVNSLLKNQKDLITETFSAVEGMDKADVDRLIRLDKKANKAIKGFKDLSDSDLPQGVKEGLLNDLKAEVESIANKKQEILDKSNGTKTKKVSEEVTKESAPEATTEETSQRVDEGTKGEASVRVEDQDQRSLDRDGDGVREDSEGVRQEVPGDSSPSVRDAKRWSWKNLGKQPAEKIESRLKTAESRVENLKGKEKTDLQEKITLLKDELSKIEGEQVSENRSDDFSLADVQSVNLSESLGLNKVSDFLDNLEKSIDKQGGETLGMNLPLVVAKGSVQAMKAAVNSAKVGADVISAGINYMKSTDWYKNLSDTDKKLAEDNFVDNMSSFSDTKPKGRIQVEEKIESMEGKSDQEIIDSFKDAKEKEMAIDTLNRKKKVSDSQAKKKLDEVFDKAEKDMYSRPNSDKSALVRAGRQFAKKIFDRQYLPKMILNKAGLNVVRNYLMTSKGASGYAKFQYDEASKKIYQTEKSVGGQKTYPHLSDEDIRTLDKIIMARRIAAIDSNREKRGLPATTHSGFLNGTEARQALKELEKEIGSSKFKDLNKRADRYFDSFRDILNGMVESGLVTKEFKDQFFEVDYQPKVYLQFLKDAEEVLSAAEMGEKGGRSLSTPQIRKMEEGSSESVITDSRYLLSRSYQVRANAMAMNKTVNKLVEEIGKQAEVVEDLKKKPKKSRKDKRTIKYFEELQKNVIIPKSAKSPIKKGYKKQVYYDKGVKKVIHMKENFHDAFNDATSGLLSNAAKETISLVGLSGLVKTIATGNNPAFFLTNSFRDIMFVATFSDVYGKNVLYNAMSITGSLLKSPWSTNPKNEHFKKFVENGGMLDYLHTQGRFKGTNWINRNITDVRGRGLFGLVGNKSKGYLSFIGNALSLKRVQMWSEIGIRMGVFKKSLQNQLKAQGVKTEQELKDKFGKDADSMLQDIYVNAVADARGTTDFSQGGLLTKDLDAAIPYLNASVQGTRVAIEQLGKDPVGTSLKMVQASALMATAPIAASFMLLGGSEDVPKEYKDLSPTERYLKARKGISMYDSTNYGIIFTGRFNKDGEAEYVRIAKAHFLTPLVSYAENLYVNQMKENVGDKSETDALEQVVWSVENNISPAELSITGNIARTPLIKAAMTYTVGYDFYRNQDLSYIRGSVQVPTEGHESKSVEDFYKVIGEEFSISPARMKGATESILTTPSTSPFIGFLYGGMDIMLSEKESQDALKDIGKNMLKSVAGRMIKHTSEYNRTINLDKEFEKEFSKIEIAEIKNKAKFKELTHKLMDKEIDDKKLNDELSKLAKDSPFDVKRMLDVIKSTVQHPEVSPYVWKIKFAKPKFRAYMLVRLFGDGFLEEREIMSKENKKLSKELFSNKVINDETIYEYKKLIGK